MRVVVVDGGKNADRLAGVTWSSGTTIASPSRDTTTEGSSGSALTIVSSPVSGPGAVGAKVTVIGIAPPGGSATGGVSPLWLKSPVTPTPVIWSTSVPMFLTVVVSVRV